MDMHVFELQDQLSMKAVDTIIRTIQNKPDALLCFAAGETPLRTLSYLVKAVQTGEADLSGCHFISLEEWVGLGLQDQGSCRQTLQKYLFDPLRINESRIHFFNALSHDLDFECSKMDQLIHSFGGIELILLGIGVNGHLGFNEPGVAPELRCHVIQLDAITQQISAKYFSKPTLVKQGITLGLRHILDAKAVLLLANGINKAEIVQQALVGPVTREVPASILQIHTNSNVYLDREAASKL